jgi:hypothetical protein
MHTAPPTPALALRRDLRFDQPITDQGLLFMRARAPDGRYTVLAWQDGALAPQLPSEYDVCSPLGDDCAAYTVAGGAIYFCHRSDGAIYRHPFGGPTTRLSAPAWLHSDLIGDVRHRCLLTRARMAPGGGDAIAAIHIDGSEHILWQAEHEILHPVLAPDALSLTWQTRGRHGHSLWRAALADDGTLYAIQQLPPQARPEAPPIL